MPLYWRACGTRARLQVAAKLVSGEVRRLAQYSAGPSLRIFRRGDFLVGHGDLAKFWSFLAPLLQRWPLLASSDVVVQPLVIAHGPRSPSSEL
mmetsp:Transcript_51389/g.165033  ORF Transcript_51389/g.165033 Transcript_51389/m.165033 type:complete len:93 (-) Transcript_51389:778-1056(-)